MTRDGRVKLTLTVDDKLLEEAKKVAKSKGVPLSRLVEKYFDFLVKRPLYCFKCGKKFNASEGKVHSVCGWVICPNCKACRCILADAEAAVAFRLRETLEDLAGGRIGE